MMVSLKLWNKARSTRWSEITGSSRNWSTGKSSRPWFFHGELHLMNGWWWGGSPVWPLRSVLRKTMSWPASWMLPRGNGRRRAKTPLGGDSGVVSEDVGTNHHFRLISDGFGRKKPILNSQTSAILNTEKTSNKSMEVRILQIWNRPVTLSCAVKRINQSWILHDRAVIKDVGGFWGYVRTGKTCTHTNSARGTTLAIKDGNGQFHTIHRFSQCVWLPEGNLAIFAFRLISIKIRNTKDLENQRSVVPRQERKWEQKYHEQLGDHPDHPKTAGCHCKVVWEFQTVSL